MLDTNEPASTVALVGAAGFGALIGWHVYYINRHRKTDVQLSDLVTLIGVLGGAAVTALFRAGSNLFGAYGLGLAIGFFGYFINLVFLVGMSRNFSADFFLDGRRKVMAADEYIPDTNTPAAAGMGGGGAMQGRAGGNPQGGNGGGGNANWQG